MLINNQQAGFTLTEVLITLGVIIIVFAATVPLYSHWQTFNVNQSYRYEILQDIRYSQARAKAGLNDSSFGVYFLSTEYILYQGDSYAARDQSQDIVRVLDSSIVLSDLTEVNFLQATGLPSAVGSLAVTNVNTGAIESITINDQGLVY